MKSKRYDLPGGGLLSYSGMSMFLSCNRKYAYRYFDKVQLEEVDTAAMDRGRAIHLLVQHWGKVSDHLLLKELNDDRFELAKAHDAFSAYVTATHNGLPIMTHAEVKIVSEEHQYIGFIDGIQVLDNGKWKLGELKTTSAFDPVKWATLSVNQQIALYTTFAGEFAHAQFLDMDDLEGSSYRTIALTRKRPSKGTAKKPPETPDDFARRIKGDSTVYHQMVRPTDEARASAMQSFNHVKEAVASLKGDSKRAPKNSGNCYSYNRPCEYFQHCWGLKPDVPESALTEIDVENL